MKQKLLGALLGIIFPSVAGFEGTYGHVFEIEEEDVLTLIESRLQRLQKEGKIERLQKELEQRVRHFFERPQPVTGLRRVTETRTWTFDPSISLSHDLRNHTHKLFYKAGTRVNPLKIRSLHKRLLFLDGDDPEQVAWAMEQEKAGPKVVWILVKGAPFTFLSAKRSVFFDQQGVLVKKLGIHHVPASAYQEANLLRLTEHLIQKEKRHD